MAAWLARVPGVAPLLRVPLFWKILVANGAVVLLAVAGAALVLSARTGVGLPASRLALLSVGAVSVCALLNGVLLRLALSPEWALERTARRVQDGDLTARAPVSPLADRDTARLIRVFNRMLDELVEYRRRQRRLAVQALEAQERIRQETANVLQERTAQDLASLLLQARLLDQEEGPDRERALERLREQATEALEEVRRTARELRPPELDDLGLTNALRAHVRDVAGPDGPELRLESDLVEESLTEETRMAVYRIVQEAVSNALLHADAEHVRIQLWQGDGRVTARVEDDGVGFEVGEVWSAEAPTLGLFSMRERTAHLGGRLTVESEEGRGTVVRVDVPTSPGS